MSTQLICNVVIIYITIIVPTHNIILLLGAYKYNYLNLYWTLGEKQII